LPDEKVWLLDGDVFAAENREDVELDEYRIQRKPEHVQRAVWQPVQRSDFVPTKPDRLFPPFMGPPWRGEPAAWNITGRVYECLTAEPTQLRWDNERRELDDWSVYNASSGRSGDVRPVADIRVAAGVQADSARDLRSTFEIEVRDHTIQFLIDGGGGEATAEIRMRPTRGDEGWHGTGPQPIRLPGAGEALDVEFWHVDQALWLFLNGRRVAYYEYDWSGGERLELSFPNERRSRSRNLVRQQPGRPMVRWSFEGSALRLHRVTVDRDLYYRAGYLNGKAEDNPTQPGFEDLVAYGTPAFGTHPDHPATLGPDHFFMLGDNSQASLDSRLWGNPHPLMAAQVDPAPFVVNRKLIVGKAWVVYFPAPFSVGRRGMPIVPDMGRLRFIR
jgi:hypothetical protein